MANLISHPFRLIPNGQIATRDETTDEYIAERIALVLTTGPGERPAVPEFGIEDPAYRGLALPALQVQLDTFGIPATITDVVANSVSDERVDYRIDFETQEGTDNG